MGDVNYSPIIEDMVWSYSRVGAFESCPYGWFLRYICKSPKKKRFYSEYGLFMHSLLERYHSGKATKEELLTDYLTQFYDKVPSAPNKKVLKSYFNDGLNCIRDLEPLPYHMIATEQRGEFVLNGVRTTVVIDYLGELDGDLYLIDHKSKVLKPRSKRKNPTKSDEELDTYFRQLYIYSAYVKEKWGQFPKYLALNCFRNGQLIIEPFNQEAYSSAIHWFGESVKAISKEEDFSPNLDWFFCKNLCDCCDSCEFYEAFLKGGKKG